MILPFSTTLNDKPTNFVEKIRAGLTGEPLVQLQTLEHLDRQYFEKFGVAPFDYEAEYAPKLHTIRADKNNRWKKGCVIDFFINTGRPDMFRFAPKLPCTGTQRIFMSYFNKLEISIDGRQLTHSEIDLLYKNDGFDTYKDFEEYFLQAMDEENEFSGKIIHWTDFRY